MGRCAGSRRPPSRISSSSSCCIADCGPGPGEWRAGLRCLLAEVGRAATGVPSATGAAPPSCRGEGCRLGTGECHFSCCCFLLLLSATAWVRGGGVGVSTRTGASVQLSLRGACGLLRPSLLPVSGRRGERGERRVVGAEALNCWRAWRPWARGPAADVVCPAPGGGGVKCGRCGW